MLESTPHYFPIILDGKPVDKITAFLFHAGGNNDPEKLFATNTIAQGDTRSTGLRFICNNGGLIYRKAAVKHFPCGNATRTEERRV